MMGLNSNLLTRLVIPSLFVFSSQYFFKNWLETFSSLVLCVYVYIKKQFIW